MWIGIGGHVENDENPYEAVLRETKEETGLDIKIFTNLRKMKSIPSVVEVPTPYMIKEEKIAKFEKEMAHYHIDLIYFGTTKNPQKIKMENGEKFGWFSQKEIENLNIDPDVEFVTSEIFKNYGKK